MWSGMIHSIYDCEHPEISSATFLPMIDMYLGDMSCIYSTLLFVSAEAMADNVTPVEKFDQSLW